MCFTRFPSSAVRVCSLLGILLGFLILSLGGVPEAYGLQATARWNANPEGDIAGYKVHYGTASRNYTKTIDAGKQTTCTIPDLVDGNVYYFVATAYDTAGNASAFSAEQVIMTPGAGFTLTVTKTGTGGGTVTGPGVQCGTDCTESIASGTSITLTAAAAGGSVFAGWSGGCTGTSTTCALTMNANKTVTATFNSAPVSQYTLTVNRTGTGSGQINQSPTGTKFNTGTVVTLTAQAASGSVFAGWSGGACSGTLTTCKVTMSANKTVTGTFNPIPANQYSLTIARTGTGSGQINQSPTGTTFNTGTVVTLTAQAASGSVFAGWSGGACSGTVATCKVTMSANKTVTATFNAPTFKITATAGSGGTISPSGAVTVNQGASKAFTIMPNVGYSIADVKVDGGSRGAITSFNFSNVGTNHTIEASFSSLAKDQYSLSVYKTGTGAGNVEQNPSGSVLNAGTVVTLTATASTGSVFAGWSGTCSGTAPTCTLTMNANNEVTADFNRSEEPQRGMVVDLDGDGKSDAIWFNEETGHLYIWHLDGAKFKDIQFVRNVNEANWKMVGWGNANGAGSYQIFWHNWKTGAVYVWDMARESYVQDQFIRLVEDTDWEMAGVGDLNGDGSMDILWHHQRTGEVYVWYMSGANFLYDQYIRTVEDNRWQIVGTGDFNRDGKVDILWQHQETGAVYVWMMDGAAYLGDSYIRTVEDLDWKTVGVGKLNGHGNSDILWRHAKTGEVYIWHMDGAAYLGDERVIPGVSNLTADPSGTQKGKIVFHDPQTGGVALGTISGTSVVQGKRIHTVADLRWKAVGVGQFDGSGSEEILWHHQGSGDVYVWLMEGEKLLGDQKIATVGDTNWKIVGIGDFNKDGKLDILWHHQATGDVYVWYMDGLKFIRDELVASVPDTNWKIIASGDLDGDGHPDLLWKHEGSSEVYMWHMNGARFIHDQAIRKLDNRDLKAQGILNAGASDLVNIVWKKESTGELNTWDLKGTNYVQSQRFQVIQLPK